MRSETDGLVELAGVGIDSSLQMKGEPLSCYGLTMGGKLVRKDQGGHPANGAPARSTQQLSHMNTWDRA
nr:MAG TPA: hypothetical protein [Caudoviricetes sp.]